MSHYIGMFLIYFLPRWLFLFYCIADDTKKAHYGKCIFFFALSTNSPAVSTVMSISLLAALCSWQLGAILQVTSQAHDPALLTRNTLAPYCTVHLRSVESVNYFTLSWDLEGILPTRGNIRALWNLVWEKGAGGKVADVFVFLMLLCLCQVSGLECLLVCPCTFCLLNFVGLSNFLISCADLITLVFFFMQLLVPLPWLMG